MIGARSAPGQPYQPDPDGHRAEPQSAADLRSHPVKQLKHLPQTGRGQRKHQPLNDCNQTKAQQKIIYQSSPALVASGTGSASMPGSKSGETARAFDDVGERR